MILSQPMAGAVLDTLADTLIPDAMEAKTQTDKPKVTGLNLVSSLVNGGKINKHLPRLNLRESQ